TKKNVKMPLITRWYARTSLLYLLASLLVGILIVMRSTLALPPLFSALSPAYFHLFLVGWITQLIFGVIFWLFPKPRNDGGPWERVAWAAWVLLNLGLLLRVVAEPLTVLRPGRIWGWGLVLSALLQWLAGMGLILVVWPRAYSRQRKQR
ncbi:MAG TPA: hypothetical protein VE553_02410, partial [Candidatus Binatia bacterium]|nr:hypothetical protein [Candidatus Binatia bacterium]